MVSTRTVTPASRPNASACRRNSSSEAGTKWFALRKLTSRFWARAGARSRARAALAPAVARRN